LYATNAQWAVSPAFTSGKGQERADSCSTMLPASNLPVPMTDI
jgi:hypothetical protein